MVDRLAHPSTVGLVISACGAVAGAFMIAAQRLALLPGALIALSLIPATAMLGMAAVAGEGNLAAKALARVGIDVGFVISAGIGVFAYKQRRVHRRRPLVSAPVVGRSSGAR